MRVVVFTKDGARIYKNPPDLNALKKLGSVVIDPDLSTLKRVPPHEWTHEQVKDLPAVIRPKKKISWWSIAIPLATLILGALAGHYVHY